MRLSKPSLVKQPRTRTCCQTQAQGSIVHSCEVHNNAPWHLRAEENICSPDSCFIYFLYILESKFLWEPHSASNFMFYYYFHPWFKFVGTSVFSSRCFNSPQNPSALLLFQFHHTPALFYLRLIVHRLLFFSPVCPLVSFTHYFIISLSSRCSYEFPAHVLTSIPPPREFLTLTSNLLFS